MSGVLREMGWKGDGCGHGHGWCESIRWNTTLGHTRASSHATRVLISRYCTSSHERRRTRPATFHCTATKAPSLPPSLPPWRYRKRPNDDTQASNSEYKRPHAPRYACAYPYLAVQYYRGQISHEAAQTEDHERLTTTRRINMPGGSLSYRTRNESLKCATSRLWGAGLGLGWRNADCVGKEAAMAPVGDWIGKRRTAPARNGIVVSSLN